MLTLLHGDNILASRAELSRLKGLAKDKEIRDINGKDISESDLRQAVESLSLFGDTVSVFIEQAFSSLGKKEKQTKLYADILLDGATTVDITLWEPKELGKTALTALAKAKVLLYKTPPSIFAFLDAILPDNTKNMIVTLEKTLESENPELLLYMIQLRTRHLIQMKDNVTPQRISPWQAMRLTNQAKSFTMNKLLAMQQQLIDLEYSFKTGATPYTLSQLIIRFIIDL